METIPELTLDAGPGRGFLIASLDTGTNKARIQCSAELFTNLLSIQRLSLSACKLDTMRRNLVIVVLALAVCRSAAAQNAPPSSTAFHWLDAVKDAALFERIKVSFADELKPDEPERE